MFVTIPRNYLAPDAQLQEKTQSPTAYLGFFGNACLSILSSDLHTSLHGTRANKYKNFFGGDHEEFQQVCASPSFDEANFNTMVRQSVQLYKRISSL